MRFLSFSCQCPVRSDEVRAIFLTFCPFRMHYAFVLSMSCFSIGEVRSLKLVKLYTERLVVIRFIYFHTLISGTFNSGGVDIHQQKINDLRFIPVDVC